MEPNRIKMKQFNQSVLFADEEIVAVDAEDVELLKTRAQENPRKRVRLCAHRSMEDPLHEMIFVYTRDTYVRPHKNLTESKSYHIIEGIVDLILFDELGNITRVFNMGDFSTGLSFFFRMPEPGYKCMVVKSDYLLFQETTNGPFEESHTIYAPWAPDEDDLDNRDKYLVNLKGLMQEYLISDL